jgi:hypothetical protein
MPDATLLTALGVPGFSLWILWMAYKAFIGRLAAKDAEHAKERDEMARQMAKERADFLVRLDQRDTAFRQLESDIRNSFSVTLQESMNVIKQGTIRLTRSKGRGTMG